jgi:hypothetical protein
VFACVFDVARTGDDGYVSGNAELAAAATPPQIPAILAASWPGLVLGSTASPVPLNLGAQLDTAVSAAGRRLYRLTLARPTSVSITAAACPHAQGNEAPQGAAALRLFDVWGRAVSGRQADCGSGHTGLLARGTYYLLLAGPTAGPSARFKLRVG